MSRIFNRVITDHTEVGDETTPKLREFCLLCHVHFMAVDVEDARMRLADYFDAAADDKYADQMFTSGQMTLGSTVVVHQPQADPEVKH